MGKAVWASVAAALLVVGILSLGSLRISVVAEVEDEQREYSRADLDAFDAWVDAWESGQQSDSFKDEGVELAKARGAAFEALIVEDPEEALSRSYSPYEIKLLPEEVRSEMEDYFSGRGVVTFAAAFGVNTTRREFYQVAMEDGSVYQAHVYGRRRGVPLNTLVPLWGMAMGDKAAVSDSPLRQVPVDEVVSNIHRVETTTCPMTGEEGSTAHAVELNNQLILFSSDEALKEFEANLIATENAERSLATRKFRNMQTRQVLKTIVFLVTFPSKDDGFTKEEFAPVMDKSAEFWTANSYGCSSFETSFATETMQVSNTAAAGACPIQGEHSQMHKDMMAEASNMGYNLAVEYDRYIFVFPKLSECSWLGLASVAGHPTWINGRDAVDDQKKAYFSWHVTAHELGHSFGLQHANFWLTRDKDSPNGVGQSQPYEDDFNVMGGNSIEFDHSTFQVNVHKKHGLTWIEDSSITEVTPSECPQGCGFRIYAHDAMNSHGLRAVRMQKENPGPNGVPRYYYMEYRTSIEYRSPDNQFPGALANGITFHFIDTALRADLYEVNGGEGNNLLDMTAPYAGSPAAEGEPKYPWGPQLNDAALQLGRTFVETTLNVYITPVGRGVEADTNLGYVDMLMFTGSASVNPPSVGSITTDCTTLGVGVFTSMSVQAASDADGEVVHYSWDFGDGQYSTRNSPLAAHKWSKRGEYEVTLTVTDGRGRSASTSKTFSVDNAGICEGCDKCVNGLCAAKKCVCDDGFTGAACDVAIEVTKVEPTYAASGVQVPVTVTGKGFTGSGAWCNFGGSIVAGTRESDTVITCTSPASTKRKTGVVRVSTDFHSWSKFDNGVVFTLAGGGCASDCGANGECDTARGECRCVEGYMGDTCNVALAATSLSPTSGPNVGGTYITIDTTVNFVPTEGGCSSVIVRFSDTAGTWEADTVGYLLALNPTGGASYYAFTPDVSADFEKDSQKVRVQISLNSGKDFSGNDLEFEFIPSTLLFDRQPASRTVNPGEWAYFHMTHSDTTVNLEVSVIATKQGSPNPIPVLSVGQGAAPYEGACTDLTSPFYDRYTCKEGDEYEKKREYKAKDQEVTKGVYYAAVRSKSGTSSPMEVSLKMATPDGSDVRVAPTGDGETASIATGFVEGQREYTFTKSAPAEGDPTRTYRITATTPSDGVSWGVATSKAAVAYAAMKPAGEMNAPILLGDCAPNEKHYVSIRSATGAVFTLQVEYLENPVLPQDPLPTEKDVNSVKLIWTAADRSSKTKYQIFYRKAESEDFVGPCLVGTGTKFGDEMTKESSGFGQVEITGLAAASNYQFNVLVTTEDGLQATYGATQARTLPEPVPTELFIYLAIAAVVLALLVGCCALADHCHSKHKKGKHHKHLETGGAKRHEKDVIVRKDYKGRTKGELTIHKDERLKIYGEPDKMGWVHALNDKSQTGVVPKDYVKEVKKSKGHADKPKVPARALADFTGSNTHELTFKKGATLYIFGETKKGWIRGEDKFGHHGLVPYTYVAVEKSAKK